MIFSKSVLLISVIWAMSCQAMAQPWTLLNDTAHASGYREAVDLYNSSLGKASALYNGSKHYIEQYAPVRESPYIGSEYWETGRVVYDDELYENVEMKYDGYQDELMIVHYGERGRMSELKLIKERLAGFTLLGRQFIRIDTDTMPEASIQGGFYELLHNGAYKLLARRKANRQTYASGSEHYDFFKQSSRYYLYDGKTLIHVKRGRKLIKYLPGYAKEMKVFLRKSEQYFEENREIALVELMRYHEHLRTSREIR